MESVDNLIYWRRNKINIGRAEPELQHHCVVAVSRIMTAGDRVVW